MVAIERRRSESHVTAQPASPLAPKPEPVPVTVRTYKEFVEKDPASAAMLLPTQHGTLLIRLGKAIADHENSQKPNRTSQALATIANQVRAKVPLSDTAKTALTYLSTSDDKLGVYKQVLLAALQHQPAPMGDCTPSARPEPI